MTQKHTPEPWRLYRNNQSVGDAVGNAVCDVWPRCDDQLASEEGKANARRIVACVNAMSGIADDNSLFFQGNSVRSVISNRKLKELDIESQRNQLQAEVDELLDLLQSLENDAAQIPQFMWTKIQRVVKKHTGETK